MNKHAFERSVLNGIPRHEAMSFLHRIKTASWGEAPDETGTLEGAFAAPIEQVIAQLTEVITAKFQLMLAYNIYSQSMRGVAQHAVAEVFLEHAEQERAAAEAYLKRAAVLGGGPVHLTEVEAPPASADPVGILMIMARAEQEGIAAQRALKEMVGEDNPLAFQIEAVMVEDQHHLDELWQLLPQDVQHTPVLEDGAEAEGAADPLDPAAAGGMEELEAPPPEMGEGPPEPELPLEEELPEEEAPPPPAAAKPPAPKAEPKPKAPSEPTPGQKEAFAIGIADLLLKQAGVADDIISGMSPEDKKGLLREEKLRSLGDSVALKGKSLGRGLRSLVEPLSRPGARKLLAGGVALGGIMGASAGANMPKSKEKQLRAGGPINRFRADHPTLTGAGVGALTGAGAMTGGLLAPHGLGLAGVIGGGTLAGGAVSGADKILKRREDAAAAKMASSRFLDGLHKLGFGASGQPEPGAGSVQGQDPGAAPMPGEEQAVTPQPSMAAVGEQPPMATEPGQAKYSPVNYLEAEETARRAQASNEAGFYRDKAQAAETSAASMGQQVQQIQEQLDQLSAQASESQNQIMAATQEAATANDQMLNQATLAARMRMGMQQLRAQMMEIASQDPEQLAAAAGGPTPMDVGQQAQQAQGGPVPPGGDMAAPPGAVDPATGMPAEPGAQPGTPDAAASAGAPPGSPPGGAGVPSPGGSAPEEPQKAESKGDKGGETTVSIKKASVKRANTLGQELVGKLPYMAIGGGMGMIAGAHEGTKVKSLRDQVDALKGQQDGGFGKSLELGKAQLMLANAEDAKKSPFKAALKGGVAGAGLGAAVGSAVPWGIAGAQRLSKNINTLRSP